MDNQPILEVGHVRLKHCRHGYLAYLAQDEYVGLSLDRYGEFSEGEIDLFRQIVQPGWTILEIGANIGAHTVFLAKAVGPRGVVHAFEPQRVVCQLLCANVALNALTNVHAYPEAVGRESSLITIPMIDYASPNNFGGLALGQWSKGEPVPLRTVDSLNLEACDFIKIDVEGMESDVVAGAVETIRRFGPVLYLENDRKEKSPVLIRQLFALGYRLYWHLPPLFNPGNYYGVAENLFERVVSINMLGVPASREQNVPGFREIKDPEEDWKI